MTTFLNDFTNLRHIATSQLGSNTTPTPNQLHAIARAITDALVDDIAQEIQAMASRQATMQAYSQPANNYYPIKGPLPDGAPSTIKVLNDYGEPETRPNPHPIYIVPVDELGAFCTEHRLNEQAMLDVVEGRALEHRGFEYSGFVPEGTVGRPMGKKFNPRAAELLHMLKEEDAKEAPRRQALATLKRQPYPVALPWQKK